MTVGEILNSVFDQSMAVKSKIGAMPINTRIHVKDADGEYQDVSCMEKVKGGVAFVYTTTDDFSEDEEYTMSDMYRWMRRNKTRSNAVAFVMCDDEDRDDEDRSPVEIKKCEYKPSDDKGNGVACMIA